jgi:hypothetical protein
MMVTHLDIYQLLDRFELLFPDNKNLSDLRRAYIDKDLSSIFRLLSDDGIISKEIDIDTIRSSVMEQNIHAIFRIIQNDDLRKIILEDNYWSLWKLLLKYQHTQFVSAFKNFYTNETLFDDDCFSRGQLESKKWLVETLSTLNVNLGTVFLCAGWYGTLATMIFENGISVEKIRSFDIDDSCIQIAEIFNKPWVMDNWKFKSVTINIHNIDFSSFAYTVKKSDGTMSELTDSPDTIINTSCEHIGNFDEWYAKIPSGKLVILQSNDYFEIKEHVNCSKDLATFVAQTPMKTELFSGELLLPKYKRFMRIGYK